MLLLDLLPALGASAAAYKRALRKKTRNGTIVFAELTDAEVNTAIPILLATADGRIIESMVTPTSNSQNVALATFGTTITTSSNNASGPSQFGNPNNINDGYRSFYNAGAGAPGGYWADNDNHGYPKVVQLSLPSMQTVNVINIFSACDGAAGDAPTSPSDPFPSGAVGHLVAFYVQVSSDGGGTWTTVGTTTAATGLWTQYSFAAVAINAMRLIITQEDVTGSEGNYEYARVAEIEILTPSTGGLGLVATGSPIVNVAAAANGASASASFVNTPGFSAAAAIDGNRASPNWGGGGTSGNGWDTYGSGGLPQSLVSTFASAKTINRIDVITIQDNYSSTNAPIFNVTTFTQYGATSYDVQAFVGGSWVTVGTTTGNNIVWRRFTFTPVLATAIRIVVNASVDGTGRLIEIEAYTPSIPYTPLVRDGVRVRPAKNTETVFL